jgi:hypothetical protein
VLGRLGGGAGCRSNGKCRFRLEGALGDGFITQGDAEDVRETLTRGEYDSQLESRITSRRDQWLAAHLDVLFDAGLQLGVDPGISP